MGMPKRYVHLEFQIDTNRINARETLPHMNTLETWADDGVIQLEMCRKAQDEASQGKSVTRARKASGYIYSETLAGTSKEQEVLRKISEILFPTGIQTSSQWNDVEIVFNAWKDTCILITDDGGSKRQPGGILGNRERLAQLGIRVMRDSEAVSEVKEAIRKRDKLARRRASRTGEKLPEWVGKDL